MRKLNSVIRLRIADYLDEVPLLDDPTTRGKNLSGSYKSIWRYRDGDYRVLCDIRKDELIILALEIVTAQSLTGTYNLRQRGPSLTLRGGSRTPKPGERMRI